MGALLGLALLGAGCAGEPQGTPRVGDALPRVGDELAPVEVLRHFLRDSAGRARVEVATWSTPPRGGPGLGEADQARRFVEDPSVVAVVGHAGSKTTLIVAPIYREGGLPLIVPTATARELRRVDGDLFMLAPPDDVVGAYLADFARDTLRAARLAMIFVADPYGSGIHEGVAARLRARGDSLVGHAALTGRECSIDPRGSDAVVRSLLARANPEVVLLALSQSATECAIRTIVATRPGVRILTSDSFTPAAMADMTPAQRRLIHTLVFWVPGSDARSQAFVSRMREATGRDPDPAHALTLDAFALVAAAVAEGHVTRDAIADWLRSLGTPERPAFDGITGPIDFRTPRTTVLHVRWLGDTLRP